MNRSQEAVVTSAVPLTADLEMKIQAKIRGAYRR